MNEYATTEIRPLTGLVAIPITEVHPSPNNPRENLTDIDGLAASILEVGLIQPIVVQKLPLEGFQIVAGHRRFAAIKRLNWHKIPCLIRRDMLPDEELLAMLVENGQRAALDPIEEARALKKLKVAGATDAEIGRKIGRSQSHVSARLALLALNVEEQEEVRHRLVGVTAAVAKARAEAGIIKGQRKQGENKGANVHLGSLHPLATRAKARCIRLHKSAKDRKGRAYGVGGVACGECWEAVIRADERQQLHAHAAAGTCPICDSAVGAPEEVA